MSDFHEPNMAAEYISISLFMVGRIGDIFRALMLNHFISLQRYPKHSDSIFLGFTITLFFPKPKRIWLFCRGSVVTRVCVF